MFHQVFLQFALSIEKFTMFGFNKKYLREQMQSIIQIAQICPRAIRTADILLTENLNLRIMRTISLRARALPSLMALTEHAPAIDFCKNWSAEHCCIESKLKY